MPASKTGTERKVADVKVRYNNMATNKSERASESVIARFSEDSDRVREAIDKTAYESAIEQIANVETQRALDLRDAGKIDQAEQTLNSNAGFLDRAAKLISSPKLSRQSRENKAEASIVKKDKNWNEARKAIKAKSYKRSKQQERD